MNKKSIISTVAIFAAAVILCVGIFAAVKYFGTASEKEDKIKTLDFSGVFFEKDDSYIKFPKKGEKLNYKDTVNYTETVKCDVYTDSVGNEYSYETDGKLSGFTANSENIAIAQSKFSGEVITEKEATDIAADFAKTAFGTRYDGYELKSVSYLESNKAYSVISVKKVGEDGFIIGSWCFADVFADGAVMTCSLSNETLSEKIGEEKINAISKKAVLDFVEESFQKKYQDGAEYEIQSISLKERNEKYFVRTVAEVTKQDGQTELTEFNYEI